MQKWGIILFAIIILIIFTIWVQADNDNSNYEKGISFFQQGKYEEALDAFDQQISVNDKSCLVWALKALTQYKLGEYKEAKVSIEHEIALDQFEEKTSIGIISQIALIGSQKLGLSDEDFSGFTKQMVKQFNDPINPGETTSDPAEKNRSPNNPSELTSDPAKNKNNPASPSDITSDPGKSTPCPYNPSDVSNPVNNPVNPNNPGDVISVPVNNPVSPNNPGDVTSDPGDNNGNSAADWISKGSEFQKNKELDKAIEAFNKALAIDPSNDVAWNNKGTVYVMQGNFDKAIEAFDKTINLNPNHENAYFNKANVLKFQGKYDEAIKVIDKALENNPNNDELKKLRDELVKMKEDSTPSNPSKSTSKVKPDQKKDPVNSPSSNSGSSNSVTCDTCCEWARNMDYANAQANMAICSQCPCTV